jgi:hypothetical protein
VTPRSGAAAAATALTLFLTACSSSGDALSDGPDGPEGSSESTSPSESPTASSTESSTETAPTSEPTSLRPEIVPATGAVLKVKGMQVNAPKGWETTLRAAVGHGSFPSGQLGTTAGVVRFPNSGLFTIEEIADEEVPDMGKGGKRLDDRFIDGFLVYHLVGSPKPGVDMERFGTIALDQRVALVFTFANQETRAEKNAIIQPVLATMQLG